MGRWGMVAKKPAPKDKLKVSKAATWHDYASIQVIAGMPSTHRRSFLYVGSIPRLQESMELQRNHQSAKVADQEPKKGWDWQFAIGKVPA